MIIQMILLYAHIKTHLSTKVQKENDIQDYSEGLKFRLNTKQKLKHSNTIIQYNYEKRVYRKGNT